MKRAMLAAVLLITVSTAWTADRDKSTEQIKQAIIRESISSYPGPCACPYNVTRNGSRCGRRSAYSKPGGYAPLCYPQDVSDAMVEKYRKNHPR